MRRCHRGSLPVGTAARRVNFTSILPFRDRTAPAGGAAHFPSSSSRRRFGVARDAAPRDPPVGAAAASGDDCSLMTHRHGHRRFVGSPTTRETAVCPIGWSGAYPIRSAADRDRNRVAQSLRRSGRRYPLSANPLSFVSRALGVGEPAIALPEYADSLGGVSSCVRIMIVFSLCHSVAEREAPSVRVNRSPASHPALDSTAHRLPRLTCSSSFETTQQAGSRGES